MRLGIRHIDRRPFHRHAEALLFSVTPASIGKWHFPSWVIRWGSDNANGVAKILKSLAKFGVVFRGSDQIRSVVYSAKKDSHGYVLSNVLYFVARQFFPILHQARKLLITQEFINVPRISRSRSAGNRQLSILGQNESEHDRMPFGCSERKLPFRMVIPRLFFCPENSYDQRTPSSDLPNPAINIAPVGDSIPRNFSSPPWPGLRSTIQRLS